MVSKRQDGRGHDHLPVVVTSVHILVASQTKVCPKDSPAQTQEAVQALVVSDNPVATAMESCLEDVIRNAKSGAHDKLTSDEQ